MANGILGLIARPEIADIPKARQTALQTQILQERLGQAQAQGPLQTRLLQAQLEREQAQGQRQQQLTGLRERLLEGIEGEGQQFDLQRLAVFDPQAAAQLNALYAGAKDSVREKFHKDISDATFMKGETRRNFLNNIAQGLSNEPGLQSVVIDLAKSSEEERVAHIMACYGDQPLEWLIDCTRKLQKRLGLERMQEVVSLIEVGKLAEATRALLVYYDQAYLHSRSRHPREYTASSTDALLQTIQLMLKLRF